MSIRQIVAPIAGVVLGSIIVALMETAGRALFPVGQPPTQDAAALRAYMAAQPLGALAMVLAGWWLGTFAGAWGAVSIADRRPRLHAGIVTGVLLLATAANLALLPHPLWMVVLGPLGILAAGWIASRL